MQRALYQWVKSGGQHLLDQGIRRVVRTRQTTLGGARFTVFPVIPNEAEAPGPCRDLHYWMQLKQGLIDAAEFLRAHVPVVDSLEPGIGSEECQCVNGGEKTRVGERGVIERRTLIFVEQAAESGKTKRWSTTRQSTECDRHPGPEVGVTVVMTTEARTVSQA
jgi:hypothetical protein